MDESSFLAMRSHEWARLAEFCDRAERGFSRLSGDELIEFVRIYRKASSDLSLISSQTRNQDVIHYLNDIVSRAYGLLYRRRQQTFKNTIKAFLADAPRTFRKCFPAFLLASFLFFGGGIFSFGLLSARPDLRSEIIPNGMESLFKEWQKGGFENRKGSTNLAMTAYYAQNNPRVGIVTNAASVASFGTVTSYLLWSNGMILGSLAHEMSAVGKLPFLLTSVSPHGVSEIGGLLITASGGYVIAWAMICPGRRKRRDAMLVAGKDAFTLLILGIIMICIAAPIEGFFSFNPKIPSVIKVIFALMALAAWGAYLWTYGKHSPKAADNLEYKSRTGEDPT